MSPALVWFRQDLRLRDNPALAAAALRGGPVLPVYILDQNAEGRWPPGAASRWWLHHSLASLDKDLRKRGSRLIVAQGETLTVLQGLLKATGATSLFWNRRYEPAARTNDERVRAQLEAAGIACQSFTASLLFEPKTVANREGKPFQVFGPFWRRCLELEVLPPVRLPSRPLRSPRRWPPSLGPAQWDLLPRIPWAKEFPAAGIPGEEAARARLKRFVARGLDHYGRDRDRPAHSGTSGLSAALHFGEIGPRQIWETLRASAKGAGVFPPSRSAGVFLSELGWREFAYHLLAHFPEMPEKPLRSAFLRFPWAGDPGGRNLRAWQRGLTGYPIVDAGMRQLWRTGWMHNRVRMIVASFLVKHLRLPWTEGAAWFWDTLVDADLANNTLGWQWSAGCGADAAPYFRIFAPVLQSRKFDPDGAYIGRWVPELAGLPARHRHAPWEAPDEVLERAQVRLGTTYPIPLVDHRKARAAALEAFHSLRSSR